MMGNSCCKNKKPREIIDLVPLPEELIASLYVNDQFMINMSCSPERQLELVVGWLYSQGLIEQFADIERFDIKDRIADMFVWVKGDYDVTLNKLKTEVGLSSGGGIFKKRFFRELKDVSREFDLDLELLKTFARGMLEKAEKYKLHGGMHSAMLADCGKKSIIISFEDIGRNNAIDKVLGWGLINNLDFSPLLLFVTGRISSDMAQKCCRAGISTIVSLNTATSMAFDIALKTGLTLICHVLKPKPILINF